MTNRKTRVKRDAIHTRAVDNTQPAYTKKNKQEATERNRNQQ